MLLLDVSKIFSHLINIGVVGAHDLLVLIERSEVVFNDFVDIVLHDLNFQGQLIHFSTQLLALVLSRFVFFSRISYFSLELFLFCFKLDSLIFKLLISLFEVVEDLLLLCTESIQNSALLGLDLLHLLDRSFLVLALLLQISRHRSIVFLDHGIPSCDQLLLLVVNLIHVVCLHISE